MVVGNKAAVNQLEIYYQDQGEGRPLILLHGATDTHALWDPFLNILSQTYWVITPDSRGHGQTLGPIADLSYRLLADDLAGLIKALGLEKPYIFGYSDGGQAALDFGIRYPDLAGALILGGVWYRFSPQYQEAISRMGFIKPGKLDLESYLNFAPPDWQDRLREAHPDPDPDYPLRLLNALARLWWTPLGYTSEDLRKIQAPTMLMMGEKEEIIPLEEAKELSEMIPNCQLWIVPGASHNQVLQDTSWMDSLQDFLGDICL